MNKIKEVTNSIAKRPDQNMSRVLQELRDFGFVKFVSKGKYRLVKNEIDISLFKTRKMSKGEKLIAQILDELGITYIQEVTHADLRYKRYLRFDFEITYKERKFVIEVDGIQHHKPIDYFGGLEAYLVRKKYDKIKDEYCKKNPKYTMIRIGPNEIKYDIAKKIIIKNWNMI